MHGLTKSLMTLLLFFSTQVFSQLQWAEFRDDSQFFSVNFPADPAITEEPFHSEYGAVFPSRIYTVELDDYFYQATVIDYTAAQQTYADMPDRTDEGSSPRLYIYDQLAATAFIAKKFRDRGGEITFDAWHHIDMVEGHQLQITNSDQSRTFAGIYLHNGRLYVLEATVPSDALPQGLFQQSISFYDELGVRVRYNVHPDRSRTPGRSYQERREEFEQ
ncbi:MAG: hypothetical protein ACJ0SL_04750 [Candidatus Rariloculaceae bacterium]